MAKVFNITAGLENLGALKTGGQGSVYKGRRTGEITMAVKILKSRLPKENLEALRLFREQADKLVGLNELHNPNLVKFIGSGITESGNYPFIEMEYIEGQSVEELLSSTGGEVFTLKESVKLAEDISNAVSACHEAGILHGDIEAKNVIQNKFTGNYFLVGFGNALLDSDPNTRRNLFENDIQQFGRLMFQILTGQKYLETENLLINTRPGYVEQQGTFDVINQFRRSAIKDIWEEEKQQREMNLPSWIIELVENCIGRNPDNRFENASQLRHYILQKTDSVSETLNSGSHAVNPNLEKLQKQLTAHKYVTAQQKKELDQLRNSINEKGHLIAERRSKVIRQSRKNYRVPTEIFSSILVLCIACACYLGYTALKQKRAVPIATNKVKIETRPGINLAKDRKKPEQQKTVNKVEKKYDDKTVLAPPSKSASSIAKKEAFRVASVKDLQPPGPDAKGSGKYAVLKTAYFHNAPDHRTRRKGFITHWNNAVLTSLDDKEGYIYVVFTNHLGQTSRGWLSKNELKKLE